MCGLLGNLSQFHQQMRRHVRRFGGLERLYDAMARFKSVSQVQLRACKTLLYLTQDKDMRTVVVETGGLPLITAAMDAFPMDVVVQQSACAALAYMGSHAAERERVLAEGAVARVRRVLELHSKNYSLTKVAHCTLSHLQVALPGPAAAPAP
jgi:hypothetical protein